MTTTCVGAPSAGGVFGGGRAAVIGHRGLGKGVVSGHAENTLGSFTAAVGLGLAWVEADARRTADDVLAVRHDATYPDGARLAGIRADEATGRGTLLLRTLFDRLPPGIGVNVDLKSCLEDSLRPPARTTAGLLAPVVAAEARHRPVLVSSFDPAALRTLREAAPAVPLVWLTWLQFPLELAVAGCAHLDVEVLGLHVGSLPRDRGTGVVEASSVAHTLSFIHGSGRQLLVWCPAVESARLLVEAGADAVVVDPVPAVLGALPAIA